MEKEGKAGPRWEEREAGRERGEGGEVEELNENSVTAKQAVVRGTGRGCSAKHFFFVPGGEGSRFKRLLKESKRRVGRRERARQDGYLVGEREACGGDARASRPTSRDPAVLRDAHGRRQR